MTPAFESHTCSAPAERSDRMRDLVVAHAPRGAAVRILDLGCGTGSLLIRLADALPEVGLTGIDVSSANVRAATAQLDARADRGRLRFETADYLAYAAAPFDLIVADGVLHLIPGQTTTLVRKLASDLRPGGIFVCDMPYDCAYNRAFAALRRVLRSWRSPWLDESILRVGRLLHGHEMADEGLRERVPYMYVAPARMMSAELAAMAASAGLRAVAEYPMKSTSLSQLRHRVTVFERVNH